MYCSRSFIRLLVQKKFALSLSLFYQCLLFKKQNGTERKKNENQSNKAVRRRVSRTEFIHYCSVLNLKEMFHSFVVIVAICILYLYIFLLPMSFMNTFSKVLQTFILNACPSNLFMRFNWHTLVHSKPTRSIKMGRAVISNSFNNITRKICFLVLIAFKCLFFFRYYLE